MTPEQNWEDPMLSSCDDLARRAAQRLSGELGPDSPAAVEAQLMQPGAKPERYEAGTLIALATLLLNATKFAWDVHRDRKKETKAARTPDAIARTIRLELKDDQGISTEQRDKIIAVVVDELIKQQPASGGSRRNNSECGEAAGES